jgi:uncharacterized membrane protein
MSLFDKGFRSKLVEEIGRIEKNSGIEVVTVVARNSANYIYINLASGAFFSFSGLTYMMFAPDEFTDEWIYMYTLISFCLGFLLMFVTPLARFFVPEKTLQRNAEIYARALFQKGKIYETDTRQGVLIYISSFEQKVIVIEDKNVTKRIPFQELQDLKKLFGASFEPFSLSKTSSNILSAMQKLSEISAKYIPIEPDDVNEIPDDLEILI